MANVGYWSFTHSLLLIYALGVLWQLTSLTRHYFQIAQWKKTGAVTLYKSFPVIKDARIHAPFAAMGTIFMPAGQNRKSAQMICLHESIHLELKHNAERIPFLIGRVVFWFHPLQWLFENWFVELQEYEVDDLVIRHHAISDYGKLLIEASMSNDKNWDTHFFSSPLKKRIHMMTREKTSKPWQFVHTILLVATLTVLLISCSDLAERPPFISQPEVPFSEVDQAPVLQVSSENKQSTPERIMLEQIYKNILYPKETRREGTEGFFKASFVVDESGQMKELQVTTIDRESADPSRTIVVTGYKERAVQIPNNSEMNLSILQQEIRRTIESLPNWEPAKHQGRSVAVKFDLFFQYRLEE